MRLCITVYVYFIYDCYCLVHYASAIFLLLLLSVCPSVCSIPLNIFVVILLLKIKHLSSENVFSICAAAHLISLLCYLYFYTNSKECNGSLTQLMDRDVQMKDDKVYHKANTSDVV